MPALTSYTRVYAIPEKGSCTAQVTGKKKLPRKLKKGMQRIWAEKLQQAQKDGTLLYNEVVYAVEPQFNWDVGDIQFHLHKTSYAHQETRRMKVDRSCTKQIPGFKYITCPGLLIVTDPITGEEFFVLCEINPNTATSQAALRGSTKKRPVLNFFGGTLDQRHALSFDPLERNLFDEGAEELGIFPKHVKEWRFTYLVETEGAFFLVAVLRLTMSISEFQEHFKQFTANDQEQEVIQPHFIPATQSGVNKLLKSGFALVRPVDPVMRVVVGLRQIDVATAA